MKVGVVVKGYPRLSETFIANEIYGLEQRGLDLSIISLRHPTDQSQHPVHGKINAPVFYLPEYLHHEIGRVIGGISGARKLDGYQQARKIWLHDMRRDFTRNRLRRFGQACVLAAELPSDIDWLYAHFLHTPASVTRYAAIMRGLPWSVSAHARDIWTSPDWELSEKLADCRWAVTCTKVNSVHLEALSPISGKVELLYHGLFLDAFAAPVISKTMRDGSDAENPVVLLSVGRAVAKKGYEDLLAALAVLPPDLHWKLIHIGGGVLTATLKKQASKLGIAARIDWRGAQPQQNVLDAYREADLFVLASKISEDGDRDGLPNVLMEAQSQCLSVVATRVSAIPELIEDECNGLLVSSGDVSGLSQALNSLMRNPARRQQMGEAGRRIIDERFSNVALLDKLAHKFSMEVE